jgi:uncharacterized OB-fold protein
MKCPKCKCVFSEEERFCPRCGRDMGDVIEKLGFFPKPGKTSILTLEDFFEVQAPETVEAPPQEGEAPARKEIELTLPEE